MKNLTLLFEKMNKQNVDQRGINSVVRVLKSGFLSKPQGGHYVHLFQKKFAKILKKKFAFATTSGTASLHAAIVSLALKQGDEILVPALTFIADASVVIQEGLRPVFVDISRDDFNLDPQDVLKKITKRTKAMIVVHLYGQPANLDKLVTIAQKYRLILIEDCAQAIGAKYKNKPVGSFGDIACFSFYQTKNLVCGEGGMIATNNSTYANTLNSILNNGIKQPNVDDYDFDHIGFNYQMTEIQAALGLRQLERLDKLNKIRRKYASTYANILAKTDIQFQHETPGSYNAYYYLSGIFPEKLKNKRDLFVQEVLKTGVPIKKQYPLSLPETEICKKLNLGDPNLTPNAANIAQRILNFYVHPGLTEAEVQRFATVILNIYNRFHKNYI